VNIRTSTLYMPLVRTPMIAPTKLYDYLPAWSPDEAADLILRTIVERPRRVKVGPPAWVETLYTIQPDLVEALASRVFHLFPSSAAARGETQAKPSGRAIALGTLVRGTQF
jgi:hypothetical protein